MPSLTSQLVETTSRESSIQTVTSDQNRTTIENKDSPLSPYAPRIDKHGNEYQPKFIQRDSLSDDDFQRMKDRSFGTGFNLQEDPPSLSSTPQWRPHGGTWAYWRYRNRTPRLKKINRFFLFLVPTVGLFAGLALLLTGQFAYSNAPGRPISDGISTSGVIQHVYSHQRCGQNIACYTAWAASISYKATNGHTYFFVTPTESTRRLLINRTVRVSYDPDHPEDAHDLTYALLAIGPTGDARFFTKTGWFFTGISGGIIILLLAFYSFRRLRRENQQ